MDPNGGKKKLFNKLGKEKAIERLSNEDFKRITVSFYKYIIIADPHQFRDDLFAKWASFSVYGRTYVAQEGINAQMSLPTHNLDEFLNFPESMEDIFPEYCPTTSNPKENWGKEYLNIDI